MIKLLKYDWKKNSHLILGTIIVLIVVQGLLTYFTATKNWADVLFIPFSVLGYTTASILLFVVICKTFDHNMKSYHRRLLPLHPLHGVGASMLLAWIVFAAVTVIVIIHTTLVVSLFNWDVAELWDVIMNDGSLVKIILEGVWVYSLLFLSIIASITVARSIRARYSTFIGIGFFFAIQAVLSWVEYLLFHTSGNLIGVEVTATKVVEVNGSINSSLASDFAIGPFIVEIVFAAALLWMMSYLLTKKAVM